MIKAGGRTIRFEINNLIHSSLNEEELSEQWKELVVVPIYKKGVKLGIVGRDPKSKGVKTYMTYRSMLLLSATYKILSNILRSRLIPFTEGNYWGSSVWIST
jgi:hypothetical protein